jgi:hypothetical protein
MPYIIAGAAALNYFGGQQASGAAQQQAQESLAFQKQMFQLQDPFSAGGNRAQYVPQLNQLMQRGYAGLQNDPMFQQLQSLGLQGTQRAMAAQGMGLGTNDLLAINQNQTGTAMNYFNQQYGRLADLAGVNRGPTAPFSSGISPVQAGQMAYAPYQGMGQAFGTIGGLFGAGRGGSMGAEGGGVMTGATQGSMY